MIKTEQPLRFTCKSVPAGWRTCVTDNNLVDYTFGPIFRKITDLWAWQKKNLVKSN